MKMLTPTDFYLLRSSAFSVDQFLVLNESLKLQDIGAVKEILRDEAFLNSIYFSSRYFYKVAILWLQDDNIVFDNNDKVLISLYKYYTRICTRSTPYGLFAGFSSGDISQDKSSIEFAKDSYTPIFRSDMLFVKKIKDEILNANRNEKIIYYSNNTIYRVGEKIRFIEWDKDYNYEISEAANSLILDNVVELSKSGLSFSKIVDIIEKEVPEYDKPEIQEYVRSLIDSKILVDCLPPYITSKMDPVEEVENYLNNINIDTTSLKSVKDFLKNKNGAINILEIENLAGKYAHLLEENTHLFQIDLKLNLTSNNINEKIVDTLSKSALELSAITKNQNSERLINFCNKFYGKFEDKEIPLVHALDPQLGVGYDLHISGNIEENPLVKHIYFTYQESGSRVEVPPVINMIIEKYTGNLSPANRKPIVLSEADVRNAAVAKRTFPVGDDYYMFGDLLADSFGNLDQGDFKFHLKSPCPNPYMSNILSRFSYHDKELYTKLGKSLSDKPADYIYAEIIHQPGDRLGNVLLRPNFYAYEIPYVTQSEVANAKIDINDIMVSVKGEAIVLRSKSLDKEIRPRLSSVYNYDINQLSIIRFLCDLQYHNIYKGFNWDWSVLNRSTYLPRVEYKELILTEARWRLDKDSSTSLTVLKNKIEELNIPSYCNLKDGDNVLLLHTANEICLNILLSRLKKGSVYVYESFHESYFLEKDKKKYAAEFVFPLVRTKNETDLVRKSEIKKADDTITREFYPGDEWSYFKIYCSHIVGDRVIKEVISPVIEHYSNKGIDLYWFFLRYGDTDHHIRLRIKTENLAALTLELKNHLQPLIEEGYVFSLQMDTYKREIERYGAENIEASEQLFHYDSVAVMKFIELSDDINDENIRWKAGVASIDILLDDFQIPLSDRIVLFENLYKNFLPEYVDVSNKEYFKLFKSSADKQLRIHKQFLDSVLRLKDYSELENYLTPFSERSVMLKNTVLQIKDNCADHSLLLRLLQSYIHMTLNRLFTTKARMHELVIYFFMYQSYRSILYRNDG